MLHGKYLTSEEVYDRPAAPLDQDPADMTDEQHTLPPKCNANGWTCCNSLNLVSLQSISLKAFTCEIYILF